MQIILDDLIVLEPSLHRPTPNAAAAAVATEPAEVSWAISARSMPPHLPPLRGGELVLVPPTVTEALGSFLPELYRQAAERGVSALVFEENDARIGRTYPLSGKPLVLYWSGDLASETEAAINRHLTETRSALYRLGSDLERRLTDLAVSQAGLSALVTLVAEVTGLPIVVTDGDGQCLAAEPPENPLCGKHPVQGRYQVVRSLPLGSILVLGPFLPEQGVVARFIIDRVVAAAAAALGRDEAARPRGARRPQATAELLSGRHSEAEQRSAALALGLDLEAVYIVAVGQGVSADELVRSLSSLGAVHAAGSIGDLLAALVAANRRSDPEMLGPQVNTIKRRWETDVGVAGTLALSSPRSGVNELPEAAQEARFVAALQANGHVTRSAASFDASDDLGVMGLLYQWRDSAGLRSFVAGTLAVIDEHDPRGVLRDTLRAFLGQGGSQVDAAQQLGIHRNTLAYRIRRINQLLDRDIGRPDTWLPLHLALQAVDMFDAAER